MAHNKRDKLYLEDLDNILNQDGIEAIKGKHFLITGAAGMIGTCLIDALMRYNETQRAKIMVTAVGRNKERATERLGAYYDNEYFSFIEQDVRQPFPSDLKPDYIIPLASNTHPLAYSQYPIDTMMINIKGAEHCLELAQKTGATVLYPSSVEIYGNARNEGDKFTEDYTGLLNLSTARACYTESKRASEALCLSYAAEKNVKVKIVRLSRIFGPTMLLSDSKASSQFIKRAIAKEDIVLKSKGEQYYSYTYVADAVSAMLCVLLHGENGCAYNISNESCNVHLRDFAEKCAESASRKVIYDLPSEAEKKGYSTSMTAILDNTKLKSLGWKSRYTFSDALERTINIMKAETNGE